MFRLTNRLALSNLIKNRKLYYPFALAVVLAVTITYLFDSLTLNPHIQSLRGASAISFTLALGLFVVTLAGAIIILYANSFVMKNRSKELGLYGMLGLEKRHLISMVFKELLLFGFLTVTSGIAIGALFDKLLYAFLLKLMQLKVELVATFQPMVVILVLITYGLIFAGIVLINAWRILRLNALQLSREKVSGEKKGRFLGLQTLLGLVSLAGAYYLALRVTDPVLALGTFFIAVMLVVLATYLLFNAGITVFLRLLKKNKSYYYQPNNMISLSNLIFRMKKNAVGLATIAILSTMVLVTMSAATSIFVSSENYKNIMSPYDFDISGKDISADEIDDVLTDFATKHQLQIKEKNVLNYTVFGVAEQAGTDLTIYSKGQDRVQPKTIFMVFSQEDYEDFTGDQLDLTGDQVALFAKNPALQGQENLTINGHAFQVKKQITTDFTYKKIPNQLSVVSSDYNYLVVPDLSRFQALFPDANVFYQVYGGMDVTASKEEQLELAPSYESHIEEVNQRLGNEDSSLVGSNKAESVEAINGLIGGTFFIGIFLSIIFLTGTVLVIYYKQISEGYEDRDRFVILQQVGLDDKQIKQTIRKQVMTVFFLPLVFAFVHLGFAYHMIGLIIKVVGVFNAELMLLVTLSICGVFLLLYLAVFLITSRSYRKIVQI